MPRISKDPLVRRNEILDTAEALFNRVGYEKTSTIDIAKTMQVAQGTLYYYFESKDALASALIARQLEQIREHYARIARASHLTAYEKIAWVFVYELDAPTGHVENFKYLQHDNNAVLRQKLYIQTICKFTPILTEIIVQGNREQRFRVANPALAAEFFLSTLHHWADSALFKWTPEERRLRLQAIQPIFENLFGVAPGSFALEALRAAARGIALDN
ncbi:TetR/AcrR family transcriptional regulator [Brevibacillus agri]|uniref:TetR/AcrR family transcriptional regulator n=1 Tax=Brevibacillus agri TaxID=51101 RepID=UPI0024BF7BB3|nr:TetR/AcrR family transcriptional regulator [Brevibacillus agri]MED4571299.1 TetR/AcrR family transcriptional regulator [Brevibacillus agri]WHX29057.1 TetR/AcrR family transcriptional regulator [Brevibacillus agri]